MIAINVARHDINICKVTKKKKVIHFKENKMKEMVKVDQKENIKMNGESSLTALKVQQ